MQSLRLAQGDTKWEDQRRIGRQRSSLRKSHRKVPDHHVEVFAEQKKQKKGRIAVQHQQNPSASRIKRTGILGLLVLTLLLAACGEGFGRPTEVRDESFSVGASPRLVVENRNGRVTVRVGQAGTTRVRAMLHKPDELEYRVEVEGDAIRVTARPDRAGFFNFGASPGADLVIEVPSNTVVDSRSSNGKIELFGVSGPSTAHTSNGAIELRDVNGEFVASTSNGKISVAHSRGAFDLQTSNGVIGFDGELSPGSDNKLETSNGSITVTLGGAPSVRIDASTSNGSIDSRLLFDGGAIEENGLVGTLGNGDASLYIETSNGTITIR